ncbi:helix-turn-helix domain-containing protein [candidate division WWE3 bacterium]|nr:helix-turn-helix domain-containing protein [candidate division WWE3 bacterium]
MNLEEKLYTSTEVADVLGVSLRSVYRYLEQGKLEAEIKTATGRLRFTKQDILNFLYPDGDEDSIGESSQDSSRRKSTTSKKQPKAPSQKEEVEESEDVEEEGETPAETEEIAEEEASEEEEIDWLSKFKAAAEEFKAPAAPSKKAEKQAVSVQEDEGVEKETLSALTSNDSEEASSETSIKYYKSMLGGLKEVAQNIDKVGRKAGVDYAFTLYAGLSLEKPLKKPFSVLHTYVPADSEDLFIKMLQLEETTEKNAQLCLLLTDDSEVFADKQEKHGLFVVADSQLNQDFAMMGLADELEEIV